GVRFRRGGRIRTVVRTKQDLDRKGCRDRHRGRERWTHRLPGSQVLAWGDQQPAVQRTNVLRPGRLELGRVERQQSGDPDVHVAERPQSTADHRSLDAMNGRTIDPTTRLELWSQGEGLPGPGGLLMLIDIDRFRALVVEPHGYEEG